MIKIGIICGSGIDDPKFLTDFTEKKVTTPYGDPSSVLTCGKLDGIDVVVGIESRGFILGGALAYALGKGFVPIRKKGKLPAETEKMEYSLEYGTDTIEIHKDAILKGQKVLLIDDLLATGGTALAAAKLIEKLGGEKLKKAGYKYYAPCGFEGE